MAAKFSISTASSRSKGESLTVVLSKVHSYHFTLHVKYLRVILNPFLAIP